MLRTRRSRLIASSLVAATMGLTVAGFQAGAAESSSSDSTAKAGNATKAEATCLTDATTLLGDLDGDGNQDMISNPGHTGTKMTIRWGTDSGGWGDKVAVKDLLGAKKGEVATAAVADFQNDGTLDLVVNIVEPADGDDPNNARLAEYRPGPVNRTDLGSADSRHSDIGEHGEAKELRVANFNKDEYPDLAILNNGGDGQLDRDVRLSESDNGPGEFNYDDFLKYGEAGALSDPPSMPSDGWKQFYKPCA
ncbi:MULTISPECIES: VCBS repeat-containing protein [unclassified Streptomyces]|uniref:FG-GAP repeat domain-containing protein n=1 Tax=unclassified Streptomyces TaxID=2593676 RepID=UPI002DDC83A9|nr:MULTISPECIES: VCBS repeat-containing protein [unclassified Streptomyces]WSA95043.1 VCBS repeat-containing protein [Streptomyces sp. NBC_01795]WSB79463.1 VCBS repeat-containing protein [Streptomyces sp. NBC_01775]WSS12332.1 VCBS repeat-containing protein [Streptomyces sp. NBC_01186]WSS41044.1 VCBS repeat-containing protein [Streptomyces sp. NBC_01187]